MADETALLRAAFERVYATHEWGQGSGPGSSPANTIEYRAFVSRFIQANGVSSVTDLGCGDWQFSHLMDWSGLDYLGLDVVPQVVEHSEGSPSTPAQRRDIRVSERDPGEISVRSAHQFQRT
jgi:hypothetical protein